MMNAALKDKTFIDKEKRLFEQAHEMVQKAEALAEEAATGGWSQGQPRHAIKTVPAGN